MDNVLTWQYSLFQVGPIFFMDSTPATETVPVDGVIFTLILISNDNDIFVSSLSFIADMETNGQMITCAGGGVNQEETIIQLGSGKNHQSCTCTCS